MLESLEHEAARAKPALVEILAPALRGVLVIGLVVGILQQITGINSVLVYAVVIFERAGAGANALVHADRVRGPRERGVHGARVAAHRSRRAPAAC